MTSFQKQRKHIKPFYSLSADFTTHFPKLYSQDFKLPPIDHFYSDSESNTKKAHLHLDMSFAMSFEQAGKDQHQFKGDTDSDKRSVNNNMRSMKIKCSSMDKICLDENSYTVHTRTEAQNPLANSPTFSPIKISNAETTPYNMDSPCMTPIEGSPMLHYIPSPFSPAILGRNRPEIILPVEIPFEKVLSTFESKHDGKAEKSKGPLNKVETQIEEKETLVCTICERATPLKDYRKHLGLCRDRAVLRKEVADIDNQIGWVVLKAFMASKTLKRNIICDRKKSSKLQSDSSMKRRIEGFARHPRTYTEVKVVRSLDPSSEKESQDNERSNSPRRQKTRHTSIQFDSGKVPKSSFRARNSNIDHALTSITLTSFSEVKMPDSNTDELEQCQSLGVCSIYLPGDGLEDSFNESETRNTQEEVDTSIMSETQRLHMHKRALSIETRHMDSPRSDILSNNKKTPKGSNKGSGSQDQTSILRMGRHVSESVCSSSPNITMSTSRNTLSNRYPASRVPSFEGYIPKVVPRKSIFCPKKTETAEEEKKEEEETEVQIVHQEVKSDEEAEEEKQEAKEKTMNLGSGEERPNTSDRKKNKSITVYGYGSCTNEQLVELRKRVQAKQKQIDVYEAIQAHAKIVIKKDVYTTEMDVINRTIVSKFEALTGEVMNENVHKLSTEFVNLFQKRVQTGKEHEQVQNNLNRLEGKSQPETPNDSKRRAILLQQKSFKNRLELKSMGKKGKDKIPSQNMFSRQNSSLQKMVSTLKETNLYTFDEKQEMQPTESLADLTEELVKQSSPVSSRQSIEERECSSMQDLPTDVKSNTVGFKDFEKLKLISKGGCAKVWLVRRKVTQEIYAMKVINLARKEQRKNDLDNLTKENKVLKIAEEEYVTRAVFVFTYETCVCFVMEFMQGGDLRQIITRYLIDEYSAKFYIAELVLAIEYLHSLGIIHRDLKPDNVLLNKDGHTKLADFGLSEIGLSEKIHNNKLHINTISLQSEDPKLKIIQQLLSNNENESDYTFTSEVEARPIGTDQYMALEVVNAISITNKTLDWWSLGIMLFELLTGQLPFDGDTRTETREKIKLGQIPWDLARKESPLSDDAKDIISCLLNPDYETRLGANGAKEIKEHAFFRDIVWEDLRKQPTPISFAGLIDTDTANFESIDGNFGQIERDDPFAVVAQYGNTERNMLIARQFIEKSHEKFQMVNIKALYSEGLASIEKIESEKEKKMNKEAFIQQEKSFTDISEGL